MEINGIAHVMLTVSDFERCKPFYARILQYMGLKPVMLMVLETLVLAGIVLGVMAWK